MFQSHISSPLSFAKTFKLRTSGDAQKNSALLSVIFLSAILLLVNNNLFHADQGKNARAALSIPGGINSHQAAPQASLENARQMTEPANIPTWITEGDQVSAYWGRAVNTAGDVNGDGYQDVIVGGYLFDNGQTNEGKVAVYYGSAGGLSPVPDWVAEGEQAGAYFGYAVKTAGDVNSDGYDDILVGAYGYDQGQANAGRVYAYYGSASGLHSSPDWVVAGGQANASLGYAVSGAGDVNGDGYDDILVGAHLYDNGEVDEGRVFLYYGSALGLSATPSWTMEGDQGSAYFGAAVSSAGDVNGDSYDDLLIGTYAYDSGQENEGKVLMYLGSPGGPSILPDWSAEGDQVNAYLGVSISAAGDVNADGYDDVIVGAYSYDNGEESEGQALLFSGSATGLSLTPGWAAEGSQAYAYFGRSVSAAGDVNQDGYDDLMVGAYGYNNTQVDQGQVYVYLGGADGIASADWIIQQEKKSAYFGFAVAGAGDVNGDGLDEVIIGAYGYDDEETDEGAAFVFHREADQPITDLIVTNSSPTIWDWPTNNTTVFTATTVGGDGVITWDFGDGAYGSGTVVTHAYLQSGDYTVVATATNSISQAAAATTATVFDAGGYASQVSVAQGESIDLYVSTDVSPYTLTVWREGASRQLMTTIEGLEGATHTCVNHYNTGCDWPVAYTLNVPASWPSGVYTIDFPTRQETYQIIFWVREDNPGSTSRLLMLSAVTNYQAYNLFGGKNIYYGLPYTDGAPGSHLSFNRPFINNGLGDFALWGEKQLFSWAESQGYTIEYATDYDLEHTPGLLDSYDVAVISGHAEYWSWNMRQALKTFVYDRGGRFVNLSGNTMWWQVRFEDNGRTMVGYRYHYYDTEDVLTREGATWNPWDYPIFDPEASLLGAHWLYASYAGEGNKAYDDNGYWSNAPQYSMGYGGYWVQRADHWALAGTGLADGEIVGRTEYYTSSAIQLEVDGAKDWTVSRRSARGRIRDRRALLPT